MHHPCKPHNVLLNSYIINNDCHAWTTVSKSNLLPQHHSLHKIRRKDMVTTHCHCRWWSVHRQHQFLSGWHRRCKVEMYDHALTKSSTDVFCSYVYFSVSCESDTGAGQDRSWQMNRLLLWPFSCIILTHMKGRATACFTERGREGKEGT